MPRTRPASPTFIEPMTATIVDALPEGENWLYEVKLDGYRALLIKRDAHVELRSRKDKPLYYPEVLTAGRALKATTAVLDGEVVAVDAHGHPSFQALQHRGAHPSHSIVFYAFDLLHLDGQDLTARPLTARKAQLARVLKGSSILLSQDLPGSASDVIAAVQQLGLEGVIAKQADSRYDAGQRGNVWVKLKLDKQQEFVIGGYRSGNHGVDALLVGYYEGRNIRFAAKVRAGFTPHVRREVFQKLKPLHSADCPFIDLPSGTSHWGGGVTAEEMHEIQWLTPRAVAQIRFVEWTADGHLRHSAFLGLRGDKHATEVRREE